MAQVTKRRKLSHGSEDILSTEMLQPQHADHSTDAPQKPPPSTEQSRSLFVRSLPLSVTSERLAEYFSQSFPLKHATVVLDHSTKASKGFGFVTFTDAEDARTALEQLNNSNLDGRKIKVEFAAARNREVEEDVTGARKETVNLKAEELRQKRRNEQEQNKPPRIIIRNLPWSIQTSDDLAKLFLSYGKVKHAVVPKKTAKGGKGQQLAGFGFVTLRGVKNAERAIAGINGKEVDGRSLAADWAVDQTTWEQMQAKDGQQADKTTEDTTQPADRKPEAEVHHDDSDNGNDDSEDDSEDGAPVQEDEEDDVDQESEDEVDDEEEVSDMVNSDVDDPVGQSADDPNRDNTVFIRNLPFTADDDSLRSHFATHFGLIRYARVVYDPTTERSRGTAFVCFVNDSDAKSCVKNAPKTQDIANTVNDKKSKGVGHSLLQDENSDPNGHYTMDGRVLQIAGALSKGDATSRMEEAAKKRDSDKRRLFLLSEGTIPRGSQLYNLLGKAEIDIRESSARQRQSLIKQNPNLGLSLTRLSIRNIPRTMNMRDLKALAREAVVGFATDVKGGKRQPLSKDELVRAANSDREADQERKRKGKGIVRQVKIVFEDDRGSKVGEGKGGRSRGYGFIEYWSHRSALMGLRWMNGHLVKASGNNAQGEKNKRLVVEFAIENAQVVQRRSDREFKVRSGGFRHDRPERGGGGDARKRKRNDSQVDDDRQKRQKKGPKKEVPDAKSTMSVEEKNNIAKRNRIIAEKRQKRRSRKGKA